MHAHLIINFADGSHEHIRLEGAIELDLTHERLRSLEFRETRKGAWVMSFDRRVMQGKQLECITVVKDDHSQWYEDARAFTAEHLMRDLTDEQRMEIMRRFCRGCGSLDTTCNCQRYE